MFQNRSAVSETIFRALIAAVPGLRYVAPSQDLADGDEPETKLTKSELEALFHPELATSQDSKRTVDSVAAE